MPAIHMMDLNERTNVFTLTTIDEYGNEHIEMFTVPGNAPTFNVLGLDCVDFRNTWAA